MGRRSLKDLRKKEIIQGLYQVAKKEGLENSSLAKVANHLGINPSLILHYFCSREELLFGLVDYILEQYRQMYTPGNLAFQNKEGIRQLIDNLFSRNWNRYFDDGVFYSCYALTYRNDRLRDKFRELHNQLRTYLNEVLDSAREKGILDLEDTTRATDEVFILVEGAYYYLGMVGDRESYDERVSAYRQMAFELLKLG